MRRKYGTVQDAIVHVLADAGSALRVRDIHERVEGILVGPVAASSVKECLRRGCRSEPPCFKYCGRRGYCLSR